MSFRCITDFVSPRGRPNRRPSFTPTLIKDIQVDEKIYEKPTTTLDSIDRNILLYAGGMGNEGKGAQGPRFKPIDNEIPDSANVQANEGPNADVPLSAIQNESKSRQQQLNLGKFLT